MQDYRPQCKATRRRAASSLETNVRGRRCSKVNRWQIREENASSTRLDVRSMIVPFPKTVVLGRAQWAQ